MHSHILSIRSFYDIKEINKKKTFYFLGSLKIIFAHQTEIDISVNI